MNGTLRRGEQYLLRHDHCLQSICLKQEKFTAFFEKISTSGRYWKFYAEHEASFNNVQEAQEVIQRGLAESVSMDLWQYYIDFVISRDKTGTLLRKKILQKNAIKA